MNKTKLTIVTLSVAALGATGAGTAFASTHSPTVRPAHTQVAQAPTEAPGTETADAPGGPDVQQGDQNAPDTANRTDQADPTNSSDQADSRKGSAAGTSGESSNTEKAGASDGPGGYADPTGNNNADTQQDGQH